MSAMEKDARTATILIRVTPEMKAKLEKLADADDRTLSDFCRIKVEGGGKYYVLVCPDRECGAVAITDSYPHSAELQRDHEDKYGKKNHWTHVYEAPFVYGKTGNEKGGQK